MPQRILVVGSTPFATRLVHYLQAYGKAKERRVLVVQHTERVASIDDVQRGVWQTYVGDDDQGRPDLIVNAYETASLMACETNPSEAWQSNSRVAAMVALAARAAEIPLVHMSSEHVFRGDNGPYSIEAAPNPINVYGVTKWYGEITASTIYPKDGHLGTTVVRHSELYGFDVVTSPPRPFKTTEEQQVMRVHDTASMVPTFIAEAAFLLARNILLNPSSLNEPILHISTKESPTTWWDFLIAADVEVLENVNRSATVSEESVRVGQQRGLSASPGWFLPSRSPDVQWANFTAEARTQRMMRFWK